MTRYVGTGEGRWSVDAAVYVYRPSDADVALARELGDATAKRVAAARRKREGYGDPFASSGSWARTGILGEIAALHPIPTGPDLDAWNGRRWYGKPDFGRLEIRTTSTWQLYGFALAGKDGAGLGGWRITAKDAGRIIVAVEEREQGDYLVWGYREADDVPRLAVPLDRIIAVVEPPDLRPLGELYQLEREP